MTAIENWLPVVGFEGLYEVSDLGNVRSLDRAVSRGTSRSGVQMRRGAPLSAHTTRKGYLRVELSKNGVKSKHHVHVLVLEAFVSPRPAGHDGAHDDGNSINNSLSNLKWKTPAANNEDRRAHGTLPTGADHPSAQIGQTDALEIKRRLRAGESATAIAKSMSLSRNIVFNIKYGKAWAHV